MTNHWHLWTDGYRYDPPPGDKPFVIRRLGSTTIEYVERRDGLQPLFNVANLEWRLLDGGSEAIQ